MAEARVARMVLTEGGEPRGPARRWDWNRVLTPRAVLLMLPVAALVIWAYWHPLARWEAVWRNQSGAWGHGYLIPVIAILIAHYRLQERAPQRMERCAWGLVLIVLGVAVRIASFTLMHGYPGEITFVLVVAGVLLWLLGWEMFRALWVSVAFLLLMIPWSQKYYEDVALPLQRLSAMATEMMLRFLRVTVQRTDNVLYLESMPDGLTVAGPCSGLHLLFAFVALGVMMAFIYRRPVWERLLIVASSVPIAVFCNFVRVTLMALASDWLFFARRALEVREATWAAWFSFRPAQLDAARNAMLDPVTFTHQSFGFAMLGLAFFLMWAELKFTDLVFVSDDAEAGNPGPKDSASSAGSQGQSGAATGSP